MSKAKLLAFAEKMFYRKYSATQNLLPKH